MNILPQQLRLALDGDVENDDGSTAIIETATEILLTINYFKCGLEHIGDDKKGDQDQMLILSNEARS